jgi:hypothetical protein
LGKSSIGNPPPPVGVSKLRKKRQANGNAAAVEAGERHEQKIRVDGGRGAQRLGDAHGAERGRLAGAPQTKVEMGIPTHDHRKGDVEALVDERA